jgi:YNFM family putative membrane transporter
MTTGLLLTLSSLLGAVIAGIIIFTIGFFGAHAIASAWVGALAGQARAQASSLYLFAYYMGSSISGTGGGFFYASWGWPGVVALIFLLLVCAMLIGVLLTALTRQKVAAEALFNEAIGTL